MDKNLLADAYLMQRFGKTTKALKIAEDRCKNCEDSHLCDICDMPLIIKALEKLILWEENL